MSDETTRQDSAAMPPASAGSMAWIPVTERLPPPYTDVLVAWTTFKGVPIVDQARMSVDEGWRAGGWRKIDESAVTFWMPLPEPPYSQMQTANARDHQRRGGGDE